MHDVVEGLSLRGVGLSLALLCGACGGAAERGSPDLEPEPEPSSDSGRPRKSDDGSYQSGEAEDESDVDAPRPPTNDAPVKQEPTPPSSPQSCTKDVDIVFVLDVSGSMAPFFWKLEEEIAVVDQELRKLHLPSPPNYGLVVFVDDAAIDQGGAPHSDPSSIRDAFAWGIATAGLGQVKNPAEFNGTFVENSLDALYLAVSAFQWRPADKTHRMIIHATDDTFWEGPPAMSGVCDDVPVNRTGCVTKGSAHSYDDVVRALRDQHIWMSAFAAHGRALAAGLVDTQPGFFTPYDGRETLPASTGGSAWDIFSVLDGTVSLSASINGAVVQTQCEDYPPEPPEPQYL